MSLGIPVFLIGVLVTCLIAYLIFSPNLVTENDFWLFIIPYDQWFEGASFPLFFKSWGCQVDISILDVFGSILACRGYRQRMTVPKLWLETLIACTLLQFGGTTITGLLLGQTPSWIISKTAFPALVLAWWLTFFSPLDFFWRVMSSDSILVKFCEFGSAVSAGNAVTSWGMDKAIFNEYSANPLKLKNSPLTCLLCGTFSACGGGLIGDWLGFSRTPSFCVTSSPTIYSLSNKRALTTVCRSFCLAVAYYMMMNPSGYLPWETKMSRFDCHLVIVLLQVFHTALVTISSDLDLYGRLAEAVAVTVHADSSTKYVSPAAVGAPKKTTKVVKPVAVPVPVPETANVEPEESEKDGVAKPVRRRNRSKKSDGKVE